MCTLTGVSYPQLHAVLIYLSTVQMAQNVHIDWCQLSTTACSFNLSVDVQMAQNVHTEFIHISVDVTVLRLLVFLISYVKTGQA